LIHNSNLRVRKKTENLEREGTQCEEKGTHPKPTPNPEEAFLLNDLSQVDAPTSILG
jgi:hypothetical protein